MYAAGALISLHFLLKKYNELSRMFRFRTIASEGDYHIIEVPNSTIACTFSRTIFLGDQLSEAEKQQILTHELVHVKQKHSLDLVFFELLKIIFWFNPLIYIYQNRITTLHEYHCRC
jgi:bla regulator protein blaR1